MTKEKRELCSAWRKEKNDRQAYRLGKPFGTNGNLLTYGLITLVLKTIYGLISHFHHGFHQTLSGHIFTQKKKKK